MLAPLTVGWIPRAVKLYAALFRSAEILEGLSEGAFSAEEYTNVMRKEMFPVLSTFYKEKNSKGNSKSSLVLHDPPVIDLEALWIEFMDCAAELTEWQQLEYYILERDDLGKVNPKKKKKKKKKG
jgi:hypothetical protein